MEISKSRERTANKRRHALKRDECFARVGCVVGSAGFTTLSEPIGSAHAVRTLHIQEVPRAVFGLPKQFAG